MLLVLAAIFFCQWAFRARRLALQRRQVSSVSPKAVRAAADATDEKNGRKSAMLLHGAEGKKAP